MNVKEFLTSQSPSLVAEKYCRIRNYYDDKNFTPAETVASGMTAFIENLKDIEPISSPDLILIPAIYTESGTSHVHADLYRKEDLKNYEPTAMPEEISIKIEQARTCAVDELNDLYDFSFPDCYSFSFSPWKEILGYEVFIPKDLEGNADALAELAEDILWEMTFHGMSEEDRQGRIDELAESLKRAEEDIKEGRVYSEEEFRQHIKDKIGYEDTRTQDEKDAAKRNMYIEMLINAKSQLEAIDVCSSFLRQGNQ